MKKNIVILVSLLALVFFVACNNTQQEEYPTKTVQVYVGGKAGGGTDKLVRLITPELEKVMGQSVVVVNKAGAAGHISNLEVVQSKPDGYTIGVLTDFETIGNILGGKDLGYTKDDFLMLGSVNANTNALILSAEFPAEKSLEGFVEYAKSNPGKIVVGTASAAQQMVLASFMEAANIDITPVLFDSGADSYNELLGGHIDAIIASPGFVSGAEDVGCKAIAVSSHERFSFIPNVPTLKESGYDVINNQVTRIFFAPPKTPENVLLAFEAALKEATESEEFKSKVEGINEMFSYKSAEDARSAFEEKYEDISEILDANPSLLGK